MEPDQVYTEQELLLRVGERDPSIYPYLHDNYYNALAYYSLSIIKDLQQAEDFAMEALVKLWQAPAPFESEGKLRGYLFTLVRNASLNYLKSQQRKIKNQEQFLRERFPVDADLEAMLVESELVRRIYGEIERLPESYRQVVELLYLQNLSSAETAEKLGISMDNLRQRKGRAIKELRTALVKIGISELLVSIIFF